MGEADTIFAVASGVGRSAVSVVRISGPESAAVITDLCHGARPPARRASLRTLRDGEGTILDRALVLWFPGPGSYTGEDSAELHLHGGAAVLAGVADRLTALGARPAEPGEFTRRAFLQGRMDLLQAEAIADLVAAETSAQRQQALRQLGGALGGLYRTWSDALLRLLAQQEAMIDFPDEDLPLEVETALQAEITGLLAEIAGHLEDGRRGEKLRDGLVFAVVGPPNVGKSTLINVLAGRDVSIVSALAGTTRDVVEARVVLGGVPVTLLDTAGLRAAMDPIEAQGVQRALARSALADLVIEVHDPGTMPAAFSMLAGASGVRRVVVANKADQGSASVSGAIRISAMTGFGIEQLRVMLGEIAAEMTAAAGPPPLTRARHRAALVEVVESLRRALQAPLAELRGEDLRTALLALGRLTGTVGTDDILDSIFAQFCIGK
jgi:tRNA modification GTPase